MATIACPFGVQFLNRGGDEFLEFDRGVQLDLVFREVLQYQNKLSSTSSASARSRVE